MRDPPQKKNTQWFPTFCLSNRCEGQLLKKNLKAHIPILIGISQPSKKKPSNSVSNFGSELSILEKNQPIHRSQKEFSGTFPNPNHHSWICIFFRFSWLWHLPGKGTNTSFHLPVPLWFVKKTLYMLLILLIKDVFQFILFLQTNLTQPPIKTALYYHLPTPPNTKKRDTWHHFVTSTPNKPLCSFLFFLHQNNQNQNQNRQNPQKVEAKPNPRRIIQRLRSFGTIRRQSRTVRGPGPNAWDFFSSSASDVSTEFSLVGGWTNPFEKY